MFRKSQSAMEYLMTYGWSILIIAVVLGALSFLGVFNPVTFAPKAAPGSCQVIKNVQLGVSNLEGSCNNQVPQYVAQFNGQTGYINLGLDKFDYQDITVCTWFKSGAYTSADQRVVTSGSENTHLWMLSITAGGCPDSNTVCMVMSNTSTTAATVMSDNPVNNNEWYFACGVSQPESLYINGVLQTSSVTEGWSFLSGSNIGSKGGTSYFYNGTLANVQIYNTTLTSSSVKTLYHEGIGGAPIDLQNLVGWYPLNGNGNDYSGNGNEGTPANVDFISNWYNGYTQP
jgi:hypothetical protein